MEKKSLLQKADEAIINEAVKHELYASNFYKYAASCTQKEGYFGVQKYFEGESADEISHYYKLRDFANDMGFEVEMPIIDKVDFENESLEGIFDAAFTLERDLQDFYGKAFMGTKDASVHAFLVEMVDIQRKSVGEYGDFIARLGLCKGNPSALLIFDQELGNR